SATGKGHCPGRRIGSRMPSTTFDAIRSDFALLDDWEDRYRYVSERGRALPPLPDALRTEPNKVRGCASQVWLATSVDRPNPAGGSGPTLDGGSGAHITT